MLYPEEDSACIVLIKWRKKSKGLYRGIANLSFVDIDININTKEEKVATNGGGYKWWRIYGRRWKGGRKTWMKSCRKL
jgi:hypothetical protein